MEDIRDLRMRRCSVMPWTDWSGWRKSTATSHATWNSNQSNAPMLMCWPRVRPRRQCEVCSAEASFRDDDSERSKLPRKVSPCSHCRPIPLHPLSWILVACSLAAKIDIGWRLKFETYSKNGSNPFSRHLGLCSHAAVAYCEEQ